jgi:hypothetical protein
MNTTDMPIVNLVGRRAVLCHRGPVHVPGAII